MEKQEVPVEPWFQVPDRPSVDGGGRGWVAVMWVSVALTGLLLAGLYFVTLVVVVMGGARVPGLLVVGFCLLPLAGPAVGALLGGFPLLVPAVRRERGRRRVPLATLWLGALAGALAEGVFVLHGIQS